jgi:gliding motility-associated-like protein
MDGYSTYCPGESIWLKAYGAYRYEWSDGSTGDSIEVGSPDTIMLIGYSSSGCLDTNYKVITEEPDWEFLINGDTAICIGDSTYLTASDAIEYYWNTGDSVNTILVDSTGTYIVYGTNQRGCVKMDAINILEVPLPNTEFTLSDYTVTNRDNEISGTVIPQDNVAYLWEMGDGLTERGPSINHTYTITQETLYYNIFLTATDQYGCTKTTSDIIDVIPFVPNVFSPNGDGTNDRFMPHINLQVFDRFGVVMYKGTEGWDGRYKGQSVEPDTYFYFITYVNREQQEKIKKGSLTLVR